MTANSVRAVRRALHGALLLMLGPLLGACGEEVELPPAAPLRVDEAVIAQLPAVLPGPHRVARALDSSLPADGERRELAFNLYYPEDGGGYPLLLFSHGNWSDKNSYDLVIEHWVSHGYAVIAPDHLDCCSAVQGIFNSLRYGQLGLIEGRVADLRRLLAALPDIQRLHPAFAGKFDPARLGLAGHSFGAFTAQQFGGAMAYDPDAEQFLPVRAPLVGAIVALSPPGPMFTTITAGSWEALAAPTLVTTGTWDIQPRFWPDWRMHLLSYETARPGDKYALVTQGADHYLGNLICRPERQEPPQVDALRMLQVVTTTFLDAYLKGDADAMRFLASEELATITAGFSTLMRR